MRANANTKWKTAALAGALWIATTLAAASAAAADPAWHVSPSFTDSDLLGSGQIPGLLYYSA